MVRKCQSWHWYLGYALIILMNAVMRYSRGFVNMLYLSLLVSLDAKYFCAALLLLKPHYVKMSPLNTRGHADLLCWQKRRWQYCTNELGWSTTSCNTVLYHEGCIFLGLTHIIFLVISCPHVVGSCVVFSKKKKRKRKNMGLYLRFGIFILFYFWQH